MLCTRGGISAVGGCQSIKVMEGWGRAGKYNQGRKLIIFPFDGFLYPAVLSSLTFASWIHMASRVVLPPGNKADLSDLLQLLVSTPISSSREVRRDGWIEEGAWELHWKEPSSTWNRAKWGDTQRRRSYASLYQLPPCSWVLFSRVADTPEELSLGVRGFFNSFCLFAIGCSLWFWIFFVFSPGRWVQLVMHWRAPGTALCSSHLFL